MKKMIIGIVTAGMISFSCSSQTDKIAKGDTVIAQPPVKPVSLNKQMFLDRIMDYEKNPNVWVYKGELPGIIDFYADWCRPCRITSPILEELAQEYAGKINFYKVDIQKEQELAAVFGVQSIPTFLFMPRNANPVVSSGIAQTPEATKEMFRKQINEILLNSGTK